MPKKSGENVPSLSRRNFIQGAGTVALASLMQLAVTTTAQEATLDLTNPADLLTAYIKTRASLIDEPIVFWFTGSIFANIPEVPGQRIFNFEGFNISRTHAIEDGYQFLSREIALYKDPQTNEILNTWDNPFNERQLDVVHVANDPVNFQYLLESSRGPFFIPVTDMGEGNLVLSTEIPLFYPSPLSRAEFPLNSQSDMYQAFELFQYYVNRADLNNPNLNSVPCNLSWTRVGPWLPFMEMADTQGNLIYHTHGRKLHGGYSELPETIRQFTEANYPEYSEPPSEYSEPNVTSWTFFRDEVATNNNE